MKVADILTELQQGWIYGNLDKPEGFSDEFMECLRLYAMEAHGQWHGRRTETAARIDKAFQAEMPKMRESLTVYRGWVPDSMEDVAAESDFTERNVISFPWYMSTSTDKEEAHYYLESGSVLMSAPNIIFEIETLAGARGIVLDEFTRRHRKLQFLENWSGEVILDKHAKFEVVWKSDQDAGDYDEYAGWRANGITVWDVRLKQVA